VLLELITSLNYQIILFKGKLSVQLLTLNIGVSTDKKCVSTYSGSNVFNDFEYEMYKLEIRCMLIYVYILQYPTALETVRIICYKKYNVFHVSTLTRV